MNGENSVEPINILLSRDELLFVLNELEADYLPGLDTDPLGQLTAEQQALALTVAGRALQARELVRNFASGEQVLHNALLTMVGVCAYAQSALMVYHWPTGSGAPVRYFAHLRGEDIAAHSRPGQVLHLFSLLPSRTQLVGQVLAVCRYQDASGTTAFEFAAPAPVFGRARELAGAGHATEAVDVLVSSGAPALAAQAFVETLGASPSVSIMQTVKQAEDGRVLQHDFTLLQNGGPAWLAVDSDAGLRIKTATRNDLEAVLVEGL
jgi:hypothetical protein